MSKSFGYIPPTLIYGKDYIEGSPIQLGSVPLVPDGQWNDYLPPAEEQKRYNLETQMCVSINTLAAIEILQKRVYGLQTEWSDRWLAKMSETTKYGNDPKKVAETIYYKGGVYEEEWPWTPEIDTWDEFYAGIPMDIQVRGQVRFRSVYEFGYQFVKPTHEKMMEALTRSPLGVDVYAWDEGGGGIYERNGQQSNHWCVIYSYKKGRYWKCYDSYLDENGQRQTNLKKLDWDFGFSVVMEYTLDKKVQVNNPHDPRYLWWQAILFFKKLLWKS